MNVLGELIVHPRLADADIDQERTVIVEEIRSYLDDPSEYGQMLIQQALFGDGPLGREICGDEAGIRSLPTTAIRDFWSAMYRPANTVVAVAGDIGHDEAVELAAAAFGTGNGVLPGYDAAPALPAGPRVLTGRRDTAQAQIAIGGAGAPARPPGRWTLARAQRRPWRRHEQPPVPRRARGEGPGVRRESGIVEYADAGALEISAGVDPARLPAAVGRILAEIARMVDEPVGEVELAKAKAYLAGGLELRMDDSRHLASWIGGQEALHDRVLTLDEALEAVDAVAPRRSRGSRPSCSPTRRCDWRSSRRRATCAGSRAPARADGDRSRRGRRAGSRRSDGRRSSPVRLARVHLRLGSLRSRGRSSRRWRRGLLDDARRPRPRRRSAGGRRPRAPARRRPRSSTGGRDDTIALVIAAEATAAQGRPGEARRLAARASPASTCRSSCCSPGCRAARSGPPRRRARDAGRDRAGAGTSASPAAAEAYAGGQAALASGDTINAARAWAWPSASSPGSPRPSGTTSGRVPRAGHGLPPARGCDSGRETRHGPRSTTRAAPCRPSAPPVRRRPAIRRAAAGPGRDRCVDRRCSGPRPKPPRRRSRPAEPRSRRRRSGGRLRPRPGRACSSRTSTCAARIVAAPADDDDSPDPTRASPFALPVLSAANPRTTRPRRPRRDPEPTATRSTASLASRGLPDPCPRPSERSSSSSPTASSASSSAGSSPGSRSAGSSSSASSSSTSTATSRNATTRSTARSRSSPAWSTSSPRLRSSPRPSRARTRSRWSGRSTVRPARTRPPRARSAATSPRDRAEHRPRLGQPGDAAAELALWFRPGELLDYERRSTAGCSRRRTRPTG